LYRILLDNDRYLCRYFKINDIHAQNCAVFGIILIFATKLKTAIMKKYLCLFVFAALILVACEGPMGDPGLPGEGLKLETYYFTVASRDWKAIGEAGEITFYQYIKDLDIGNSIYERGNVSVFIYLADDGNEVQSPLPYSIPHTDGGVRWTEHYSFDFDLGTMSFYADYLRGETPPPQEFRVVLTW
jgi:hypothetical protein